MFDTRSKQTVRFLATFATDEEVVRVQALYSDAFAAAFDDVDLERLIELFSTDIRWGQVSDDAIVDSAPFLFNRPRASGEPQVVPRIPEFPPALRIEQKRSLFRAYVKELKRGKLRTWEIPYLSLLLDDPAASDIDLADIPECIERAAAVGQTLTHAQGVATLSSRDLLLNQLVQRWLMAENWAVDRIWHKLWWIFDAASQCSLDYSALARHLMPQIEPRREQVEAAFTSHPIYNGVGCTAMRPALSAFLAECQILYENNNKCLFSNNVLDFIHATPRPSVGGPERTQFIRCASFPEADRIRWFVMSVQNQDSWSVPEIENLGLSRYGFCHAAAAAAYCCGTVTHASRENSMLLATGVNGASQILAQARDLDLPIEVFLLQMDQSEQYAAILPDDVATNFSSP